MRRLAVGVGSSYASRGVAILAQFAILGVAARVLDGSSFGLYALTGALVTLFTSDFGVGGSLTRFIALEAAVGRRDGVERYCSAGSAAFMGLAVALGGVSAVAFQVSWGRGSIPASLRVDAGWLCVILFASVVACLGGMINRQILVALGKLYLVNGILVCSTVARLLGGLLAVLLFDSIIGLVCADLVGILFANLACAWMRRRQFPEYHFSARFAKWSTIREVLPLSLEMLAMSLAASVIVQAGSIIASVFLPIASVGVYSVAQRAYYLARESTQSLTQAILPEAANAASNPVDGARLQNLYVRGTMIANVLLLAVAVPLMVFMDIWLTLWVGSDLAGSAVIPALILVGSVIVGNNHLVAIPVLAGQGSLRVFSILHVVWGVSGAIAAILLASRIGLTGVAVGLCGPVVFLEWFYVGHSIRRLEVRPLRFLKEALALPWVLLGVPGWGMWVARTAEGGSVRGSIVLAGVWLAYCCVIGGAIVFGLRRRLMWRD